MPRSRQPVKISPHSPQLKAILAGNGPEPLGQLRRRRAQPLRILLGRRDGHAENLRPVDQPADVPDQPLRGPE